MHVPLNKFNPEQRLWYAHLIVAAIKSDEGVTPTEMTHLVMAMHFLTPEEKEEIQVSMHLKVSLPGLKKVPKGLSPAVRAAVFTDLVRVVVSDGNLSPKEKAFLLSALEWFELPKEVASPLMNWCESSLKLEQERRHIVLSLA